MPPSSVESLTPTVGIAKTTVHLRLGIPLALHWRELGLPRPEGEWLGMERDPRRGVAMAVVASEHGGYRAERAQLGPFFAEEGRQRTGSRHEPGVVANVGADKRPLVDTL